LEKSIVSGRKCSDLHQSKEEVKMAQIVGRGSPKEDRVKIVTLWGVFLLGLLFHTQLALMPLFHGLSVQDLPTASSIDSIGWILWLMLAFFVVPMLMIIGIVFITDRRFYQLHYLITLIYSGLNFAHLLADLQVKPVYWYQIVLMTILLLIGLLLNLVAWRSLKFRQPIFSGGEDRSLSGKIGNDRG
jgi:hypothetical protein